MGEDGSTFDHLVLHFGNGALRRLWAREYYHYAQQQAFTGTCMHAFPAAHNWDRQARGLADGSMVLYPNI